MYNRGPFGRQSELIIEWKFELWNVIKLRFYSCTGGNTVDDIVMGIHINGHRKWNDCVRPNNRRDKDTSNAETENIILLIYK